TGRLRVPAGCGWNCTFADLLRSGTDCAGPHSWRQRYLVRTTQCSARGGAATDLRAKARTFFEKLGWHDRTPCPALGATQLVASVFGIRCSVLGTGYQVLVFRHFAHSAVEVG